MSYMNEGNEVGVHLPVEYVGLLDYYPEPLSIFAEEKIKDKVAAIKKWGSKLCKY